jgi:succinate-semialdehyde dehydrogenase/glutarate-semialdehyde dehydrogenase
MNNDYPALTQYIAGEWRSGHGSASASVLNPATGELLGQLAHANAADVADAIDAAAQAFGRWRAVAPVERGRLLRDTATLLRERRDRIARLITLELGKPFSEALREVDTAAEMFEWSAEEGRRAYGRLIPARMPGITQTVMLEPIGPVAAFSGWNAPAVTPSRKISGALAAGCSIVLKPSEETPAVALAIARAAADAGVPAGVVNLVFGDPAAIAEQLMAAAAIRMLSFTGATAVGRQLAELAARTMKRATLELGGHAPVLVFDDVDVPAVARAAAASKFRNAGQVCISPTRFHVHESVYDQFCQRFVQATQALKVGNGLDPAVQMGPVKNERRRAAIERLVADASDRGARVLTGGQRLPGPGWFHAPTVLGGGGDDALAANQEPFGPLALVRPFQTFDEAITQANRLPFGLTAYAFTRDVHRAHDLAQAIESGVVCINEWQASLPETPFGGVKDSGLGSEGGIEGLREFQSVKCVRMGRSS